MDTTHEESATAFPILDATEARIVGCLVEKASTTPEAYPLTVNAIVAAANQKTSREPVMHLDPGAVEHALRELESRGIVRVAPSSQRALRYEHRFDAAYGVTARQRAALCVMMLRGPQTLGEILTRSERLVDFPDVEDVRDTLDRLIQRDPPLAVRIPRSHGQREDRYQHLLSGDVDTDAIAAAAPRGESPRRDDREERIARLEGEMAELRDELAQLRERIDSITG